MIFNLLLQNVKDSHDCTFASMGFEGPPTEMNNSDGLLLLLNYSTFAVISCNFLDECCLSVLICHNRTKTAFTN